MHSLLCEATLSRRCEARCAGDVPRMTVMLPARVCLQAVINYINTKTESEWCAQNAAAPESHLRLSRLTLGLCLGAMCSPAPASKRGLPDQEEDCRGGEAGCALCHSPNCLVFMSQQVMQVTLTKLLLTCFPHVRDRLLHVHFAC